MLIQENKFELDVKRLQKYLKGNRGIFYNNKR